MPPEPIQQESSNLPIRTLWTLLGVLVVIVIAAAGWYYWSRLTSLSPVTESNTRVSIYTELLQDSQLFSQAEQLRKSGTGDLQQMLSLYERAQNNSTDVVQKGQIEYMKAVVQWKGGDAFTAIPILKAIAANTAYPAKLRAQAVQELTLIPHTSKLDNIAKAIFVGDPYAGLLQDDNVRGAYINLLRYAAALYPLAISELQVATYDFIEYEQMSQSVSTTSVEMVARKHGVFARIATADKEIEHMRGNPGEDELVPVALLYRAILLGKLNHTGDTSLGSASTAFQLALDEYASRGLKNAFANYNYALYLAWSDQPNVTLIQKVLLPIFDESMFGHAALLSYLTSTRFADDTNWTKINQVRLAQYDSKFKELLKTLGWTDADLSVTSNASDSL